MDENTLLMALLRPQICGQPMQLEESPVTGTFEETVRCGTAP